MNSQHVQPESPWKGTSPLQHSIATASELWHSVYVALLLELPNVFFISLLINECDMPVFALVADPLCGTCELSA